jgi:hypothetical protein
MSSLSKRHFQSIRPRSTEAEIIPAIEALEAQENISISTLISISMDFGYQSSLLSLPSICDSSPIPPQLQSTTMSSNTTTTNDSKTRKNREESYMNESNIQQVGNPTSTTSQLKTRDSKDSARA